MSMRAVELYRTFLNEIRPAIVALSHRDWSKVPHWDRQEEVSSLFDRIEALGTDQMAIDIQIHALRSITQSIGETAKLYYLDRYLPTSMYQRINQNMWNTYYEAE